MEMDESSDKNGKMSLMDQQDKIDDVVEVNLTAEEDGNESESISSAEEQISDTWNTSSSTSQSNLNEDAFSFSQAIQPPCCNLSISSATLPPNLNASKQMIDDDIGFGPEITNNILLEDFEVDLLQRTPIHELGTNADNEGKVFDYFTEPENYPQIHPGPGYEFMENSNSQCSSNNAQSPPCADLGEGSESMVEKGNKDRISELPDALIHHIFSFLDMELVIQTCVLSRRWRYLWASVPTIRLCENDFSGSDVHDDFVALNSFINFVDRFLLLRDSSSHIGTFKLKWDVDVYLSRLEMKYDVSNRIATWVLPVVKHNVEVLILVILHQGMMKLPDCLFTSCKSLTKFKFRGFGRGMTDFFLPDVPMYFPGIRFMAFTGVSLLGDENLTSKLFSSCPVLESLLLTDCSVKFDFSSFSLKHFKLDNYEIYDTTDEYAVTVKLSAPNLTSLICNDFMSRDYHLENLSSLVTADIGMRVKDTYQDYTPEKPKIYSDLSTDVRELYGARMINFLRAVRNVTDLKLSSPGFLEVVSGSFGLLAGSPDFQFSNLRFLKIVTWVSRNCMNAVAYLFRISPNLESIFLTVERLNTNDTEGGWVAGSCSFPCLHYLKFVQIEGIQGCLNELNLLQVLLEKAIVLEKVTLFCCKKSPERAAQLMEFKETVLAYPSASSSVSISIQ